MPWPGQELQLQLSVAAWVENFETVYSKSRHLKLLISKIKIIFAKKYYTSARATPGEQVVLIISPKIIVILEIKSFKVAKLSS
jgi:hypothetical protein